MSDMTSDSKVLAAPAEFSDAGPGRDAWKVHVVRENGDVACGAGMGFAAIDVIPYPARLVPDGARCQRSGCRQRWPDSASDQPLPSPERNQP